MGNPYATPTPKPSGDITEEGKQGPKEPERQDKCCNIAGTQLPRTLSNVAASTKPQQTAHQHGGERFSRPQPQSKDCRQSMAAKRRESVLFTDEAPDRSFKPKWPIPNPYIYWATLTGLSRCTYIIYYTYSIYRSEHGFDREIWGGIGGVGGEREGEKCCKCSVFKYDTLKKIIHGF